MIGAQERPSTVRLMLLAVVQALQQVRAQLPAASVHRPARTAAARLRWKPQAFVSSTRTYFRSLAADNRRTDFDYSRWIGA